MSANDEMMKELVSTDRDQIAEEVLPLSAIIPSAEQSNVDFAHQNTAQRIIDPDNGRMPDYVSMVLEEEGWKIEQQNLFSEIQSGRDNTGAGGNNGSGGRLGPLSIEFQNTKSGIEGHNTVAGSLTPGPEDIDPPRQTAAYQGHTRQPNPFHRESQTSGFNCLNCPSSFTKKCSMQRHVERMHTGAQEFECEICTARFRLQRQLENHEVLVHRRVPKNARKRNVLECSYCKRWIQGRSLPRHIEVTHSSDSEFKCKKCFSSFRSQGELKLHENSVHAPSVSPEERGDNVMEKEPSQVHRSTPQENASRIDVENPLDEEWEVQVALHFSRSIGQAGGSAQHAEERKAIDDMFGSTQLNVERGNEGPRNSQGIDTAMHKSMQAIDNATRDWSQAGFAANTSIREENYNFDTTLMEESMEDIEKAIDNAIREEISQPAVAANTSSEQEHENLPPIAMQESMQDIDNAMLDDGSRHTVAANTSSGRDHENVPKTVYEDGQECVVCPNCDAICHPDALHEHIKRLHLGAQHVKCSLCPATFSTSRQLTFHMSAVHNTTASSRGVVCPMCGAALSNKSKLRRHILLCHEGDQPHNCDKCIARFKTAKQLLMHKKTSHKG